MPPKGKKRAPTKRPAKPKPAPLPPPKKRSKAFRKAALAASGLATLSVLLPHIQKLLTAEEMHHTVHGASPGSAAAGYPRTATRLEDDELDDLADAFAGMGTSGDAEAPNRPYRAAMNVPQPEDLDPTEAAALDALHRAGAAMMVPKKTKGWSWPKGKGLGLTGEKTGSAHVAALYGAGLLQSKRYQALAEETARRLAKTRRIGAAAKLKIVNAAKAHLKHVAPRKLIQNMTRPQAMAAAGSLLAAVVLATGGRERLASAVKAGMKLSAFREMMGSRGATPAIGDDWEDVDGPGVVAWQKAADDQKRKGDTSNAMLGSGMQRLPGACWSGRCDHLAHMRFSTALE